MLRRLLPLLLLFASLPALSTGAPLPSQAAPQPVVRYDSHHDLSPPLHTLQPLQRLNKGTVTLPFRARPRPEASSPGGAIDPLLDGSTTPGTMPAPLIQWEGIGNLNGMMPPDPNGDVGPSHYVQWVNGSFQIWDKQGTSLYGPAAGNTLWRGFGGLCEATNHGDPIVLYDPLAERWLMSQFALGPPNEFRQCIAISQSADPLGAWYRYDFLISNSKLNDYPKFGVWPDGYYMSINQFDSRPGEWAGAGVVAFERSQMLAGHAAAMIYFDLEQVNLQYGGLLPADLDGPAPPPGSPAYFAAVDQDWHGPGSDDLLHLWEFSANWATPPASTFTLKSELPIAPFDWEFGPGNLSIPQPDTPQRLHVISDRLMFRLQYRNFGSHESLVANHTVDADGSNRAGIRWYEVRDPGGTPYLHQQGSYAPDEAHRWMGSIAMDRDGNIALGYSVSSAARYPSIGYTGRLAGDPPSTMRQGEGVLIEGQGSQLSPQGRWGDYSALLVDPVDDCTFWYTQEYYDNSSGTGWKTHIGAFRFPTCTTAPKGVLEGQITDEAGVPLAEATISLGALTTMTDDTGRYRFLSVPVGQYEGQVHLYGYESATLPAIVIREGATTTVNARLRWLPRTLLEGTVRDGSGAGWPLYARLDIEAPRYAGAPRFSNPVTGYYSVSLVSGMAHTLTVRAMGEGYLPLVRTITPSQELETLSGVALTPGLQPPPLPILGEGEGRLSFPSPRMGGGATERSEVGVGASPQRAALQEDVSLQADSLHCNAPGYAHEVVGLAETFDADALPTGWHLVDNLGNGQGWRFDDPGAQGNLTGGSGGFAVVNSDFYGKETSRQDAALHSPPFDLSQVPQPVLQFNSDFYWWKGGLEEVAEVDVSTDGGSRWSNVWRQSGGDRRGPRLERVDLSALAGGQPEVRLRFHYFDAQWERWWQIDNVRVGEITCEAQPGGLFVGNVLDGNTGLPVETASLRARDEEATQTLPTPLDPAVEGAFFALFAPAGTERIVATAPHYGEAAQLVSPLPGAVAALTLHLPAGQLALEPSALALTVAAGSRESVTVRLQNSGHLSATVTVEEVNAPAPGPLLPGTFAPATRHLSPKRMQEKSARYLYEYVPPAAPQLTGGAMLGSFESGLEQPWGIAYDSERGTLWLGETMERAAGVHAVGTQTVIPTEEWDSVFGAGMSYDSARGTLWQVAVGGENCLHEIDPVAGASTGERICPPFGTSQRGLAYDPATDTFYAGSWNDGLLYHFDRAGRLLGSRDVGLPLSDLALNPATGHLFVLVNAAQGFDIYVLDSHAGYELLGGFDVAGLDAWEQAGLTIDCDGHLWLVNQASGQILKAASGEVGSCAIQTIPWLTVSPLEETIPASGEATLTITADARALPLGSYRAHLRLSNDTPYGSLILPITVTVPRTLYLPLLGR